MCGTTFQSEGISDELQAGNSGGFFCDADFDVVIDGGEDSCLEEEILVAGKDEFRICQINGPANRPL